MTFKNRVNGNLRVLSGYFFLEKKPQNLKKLKCKTVNDFDMKSEERNFLKARPKNSWKLQRGIENQKKDPSKQIFFDRQIQRQIILGKTQKKLNEK